MRRKTASPKVFEYMLRSERAPSGGDACRRWPLRPCTRWSLGPGREKLQAHVTLEPWVFLVGLFLPFCVSLCPITALFISICNSSFAPEFEV